MIARLGNWIADRMIERSKRNPYEHLRDYMDRFWLFRIWREGEHYAKVAGRIHNIKRSDNDRHCHCHPWPYLSIILKGGYWEVRETSAADMGPEEEYARRVAGPGEFHYVGDNNVCHEKRWQGPGSVLFRRSTDRHRLVLPESVIKAGGTWTLFITFPKAKSWFFYTEDGAIRWTEYDAWRAGRPGRG